MITLASRTLAAVILAGLSLSTTACMMGGDMGEDAPEPGDSFYSQSSSPPVFYEHVNFGGQALVLNLVDPGDVRMAYVGDQWNDRISSVAVPAGSSVTLFFHGSFTGASVTLTSDIADLRSLSFNDATSSIIFRPSTSCVVDVPSCPNYPSVGGTFEDSWNGSESNQAACMKRARDYYDWCEASDPVVATFLSSGTVVQTTTYP